MTEFVHTFNPNERPPCPDCGTPVPGQKPPPIVLNVAGIEAKAITLTPDAASDIDWPKLVALPPFQMFVAEKMKQPGGKDALEAAIGYASSNDGESLFKEYVEWHAAQGYWPNESPLGEPLL